MSDSVDEPWSDAVDVTDMTEADFERRYASLTVHDPSGASYALAARLGDAHDLSPTEVADRALRVYLAHVIDNVLGRSELRGEHETTTLIPPRGWQPTIEWPTVEVSDGGDRAQFTTSTAQTVRDMLDDVMDDLDADVNISEFVWAALVYLGTGDDELVF